MNADQLRRDLLHDDSADMRRRRAIIGCALGGMAAMAPVSLRQTGIVKHLPDPPIGRFHSDETVLSEPAYMLGVPDATLALASMAATIPLAAWGTADRAQRQPWVPLLAASKAVADAIGTASYFWRMVSGKEPWCAYCLGGAIANFSVLCLVLPEGAAALRALSRKSAAPESNRRMRSERNPQPASV